MHDVHTTTAIDFSAPPVAGRIERRAFIIGGFAAIVSVVAAFLDFHYFLRPYLVAYMFVLGVTLGCLSLLLLEKMTSGQWGVMSRRILEAATAQLPMMAILFLPIAFGLHSLYHWSHAEAVANDPVLQAKAGYLNAGFWYLRAVIYFAIWLFLGFALIRCSRRQDTQGSNRGKIGTVAGPGIVLYVLTITFSSVDWVMSLNPHWFSTMFGLLFVAGNVLMAMSFVAMITATFMKYEPFSLTVRLRHLHDYGKLMLAFTMLWAYLNFSQWLIVWSGNLPEETPWYIARLQHGWQYVSLALIVFHFILPFLLLLSRDLKKNTKTGEGGFDTQVKATLEKQLK